MPLQPPPHAELRALHWVDEGLWLLDQRQLPQHEAWSLLSDVESVAIAIETLTVRGAPAIGGAAACGTCHVFVEPAVMPRLAPPREEEEWQLDRLLNASPASRLACQIIWRKEVLDGVTLTLAPSEG